MPWRYMREWGIAPPLLTSTLDRDEWSALLPGKSRRYHLNRGLGGPQSRSRRCGEETNFLLPGSTSLYWLSYLDSKHHVTVSYLLPWWMLFYMRCNVHDVTCFHLAENITRRWSRIWHPLNSKHIEYRVLSLALCSACLHSVQSTYLCSSYDPKQHYMVMLFCCYVL
jgi:hypothetical protein